MLYATKHFMNKYEYMSNVNYRIYLPLFTSVCSCSNCDSEVTKNESSSIKGIFYPDLDYWDLNSGEKP